MFPKLRRQERNNQKIRLLQRWRSRRVEQKRKSKKDAPRNPYPGEWKICLRSKKLPKKKGETTSARYFRLRKIPLKIPRQVRQKLGLQKLMRSSHESSKRQTREAEIERTLSEIEQEPSEPDPQTVEETERALEG
jgi:hypothetical protein